MVDGETITLPRLAISNELVRRTTNDDSAEIERLLLRGKARSQYGQLGDFLAVLNQGASTFIAPEENEVELRFVVRGLGSD